MLNSAIFINSSLIDIMLYALLIVVFVLIFITLNIAWKRSVNGDKKIGGIYFIFHIVLIIAFAFLVGKVFIF